MTENEPSWGLLPVDVYSRVHRQEWTALAAIKGRLSGRRPFPLRIPLKPPTGNEGLKHILHLQAFLAQWREFPYQHLIERESRRYRSVGEHDVAKYLVISSVRELLEYLGPAAVERSKLWERRMGPFLALDRRLAEPCIAELGTIESMPEVDIGFVTAALQQLEKGMGEGLYLRALPLTGIHTKLIETYEVLITKCLDVLHNGEISRAEGLLRWLGCREKPTGWLWVRPLCDATRSAFGGLHVFKLAQQDLARLEFPCKRILVVENEATGLALPRLADTVAVFGGGLNVSWLANPDLARRSVYYWGDIDSYGFKCLSDARGHCSHLRSIMMDRDTCRQFNKLIGPDEPFPGELANLTREEGATISAAKPAGGRLEQEQIAQDWANSVLEENFYCVSEAQSH